MVGGAALINEHGKVKIPTAALGNKSVFDRVSLLIRPERLSSSHSRDKEIDLDQTHVSNCFARRFERPRRRIGQQDTHQARISPWELPGWKTPQIEQDRGSEIQRSLLATLRVFLRGC